MLHIAVCTPEPETRKIACRAIEAALRAENISYALCAYATENAPPDSDIVPRQTADASIGIPASEILFAEARGHYLCYCKTNGKMRLVREKISDAAARLARDGIVRVHKSYLVNLSYVRQVQKQTRELLLPGGVRIRYGRSYAAEFLHRYAVAPPK